MQILQKKDSLLIKGTEDFNVIQTLNCGQIFRYVIDGDTAVVYSKDKKALLTWTNDTIEITSKDIDYFYHFFDLSRDYAVIKSTLKNDEFLAPAVEYGYGIRILNNDAFEMIVSFIISANNNIKRIKNSIEYLCKKFGEKSDDYHAFPTLSALKKATISDYEDAGLGYRAEQMHDTIQRLTERDILYLQQADKDEKMKFLLSLKGVGEKVANCIMLFGLGVRDVFPVDTWINKVYNHLTDSENNDRKKITRELTARYKDLSGFAQQYFFYYFRENKIK